MVNGNAVLATVVAVVLVYALLGLVLSYAWNNSIRAMVPSSGELGVWNALMLLVTVHVLTGSLHTTVQRTYNENN